VRTSARVVVIGGGIAGASVLYHLARLGWVDTVLLEQGEVADGTTSHSAGHCIVPFVSRHMTRFSRASIQLFRDLEIETGRSVGFLEIGSLTLATTTERVEDLKHLAGAARVEGVPFEILTPEEASLIWPTASMHGVIAAAYSPTAGRVDPSSAAAALAAAAVQRGAEVCPRTRVVAMTAAADGTWLVETSAGVVRSDYVVNATGQWARDLGQLAGIVVPVVPLEHQYVLSGPCAESQSGVRLPILRDPDHGFYLRQEGNGLLVGMYEDDARTWATDGVPQDFLRKLLPPDIDRIAPWFAAAEARVPALARAGIRTIVNGPDAYTTDDRFLMGPVAGSRTYFLFAGFNSAGVQTSPGAARYLAEWIVGGEPTADLDEFDARRFGAYATGTQYLIDGAKETYRNHYPIRYPIQERESGRPLRTSPIYDQLAARRAVFGERFGWERAVWFAGPGDDAQDHPSFGRPNWFDAVGRECVAVRDRVGVVDQTSFAKYMVTGPGAGAFLDSLIATALPAAGSLRYALLLNSRGTIETDMTIACVAPETYYLVCAAASEVRDRERILELIPTHGTVSLRTVTTEVGVLTVTGPKSRELLERVTGVGLSDTVAPFMSVRNLMIGHCAVRALRVAYSGELGWELHMPVEMLREAYLIIIEAGVTLGISDVGYRALDSLGLEKGYGALGLDLTREYTPLEAGLAGLIRFRKEHFIGRDAILRQRESGVSRSLAWLLLDPDVQATPSGMEPVLRGDDLVGFTVRGGFGYRIGRPLAVAYLPAEILAAAPVLSMEIQGEIVRAELSVRPPYDPDNQRRSGVVVAA
jgi:dimethylglycine dehydrogenase